MSAGTKRQLKLLVARILPVALVVGMCAGVIGPNSPAFAATPPKLDLKVLLIGQGTTDPTSAAWQAALTNEGVPFDLVTAGGTAGSRTATLPTLSDGNVGHYNGIVIANSPTDYAAETLAPLFAYESAFGVRQLNGYMYPSPALGVTAVDGGSLATDAHLTAAGLALMPGLKGPLPFDAGSYGYTAAITPGAPYTSIIDAADGNTMAGIYQHPSTDAQAGVSELSLNFNYNANQLHWLLLAPGLINWVTQNTHLGLYRNYFGQDIDDVFIADNEWSSTYQCTPAATEPIDFNCPPGVVGNPATTPPDTLMTAADVAHVVAWQQQTGIRLNLAFNAVGACTGPTPSTAAVCTGGTAPYALPGFNVDETAPDASALTTALLANKAEFNWIMHTWSHAFLGCNVWGAQSLTSVTANAGGGTFPAGVQNYKITAATAYGESEPSTVQAVTLAAGDSASLTWPEATNGTGDGGIPGPTLAQEQSSHIGGTGFWGYNVYRLKSDATYGLVGQVPEASGATASTTYSFTDTGTAAGRAPESDSTFPTATNPGMGCTTWLPAASIQQEIGLDQAWAAANGLTSLPADQYTQTALVTGEHSGVENPNMPAALDAVGVTTFAQDASRQPTQYSLGNAIGAPRYPSNIYYNASNWTDQLNEYNTLYVAQGVPFPGGTGRCVNTSSTTCRATPATKADLLASDSHIMLSHVLANDPRVGYAHQPNLIGSDTAGEGYTLLDLIDTMLGQYNSWYTEPLTQLTDTSSATVLAQQTAWANAQAGGKVTASITNGVVTVANTGTSVDVPVTVPAGTTVNGAAFGESYGGTNSAWTPVGSVPLVLNATVAPTFLSAASASAIVGAPFSTTVFTTGSPTATIAETGSLPSGITFTDNGNGTATIAGTAAAGSGGSYPLSISATSSSGTATQAFTLANSEAPTITSASTATFSTGVASTYTVTTTGYPAATITYTGDLPGGLTFTAGTDGKATVAGTAATGTAGTYPVTISATNSSGSVASLALTITVSTAAAPAITSGSAAFFTVNQFGAAGIITTGSPTAAITEIGALPAGLTFKAQSNGTALIQGTPTATGTSTLSITATNGINPDATQTFTIVVGQAPSFTSPASASFTAGTASSFQVTAAGYPAPAIGASGLPSGLGLIDNGNGTATISGIALAGDAGDHNVSLTTVNGTGTGTQTLVLTVIAAAPAAPAIGTATAGNATATVTWTAPANNGSPITGYSVKVVNSATNAQIGALRPAGATATSLLVTGLVNGTAVKLQVQATNATGTGAFSALSNAVTPAAAPAAPAAPAIRTATAGNATATATWTAPANNGSPITGYSVKVVNSATNTQIGALRPAGATATSLLVTGLVNGTAVKLQVQATNATGTGAFSALSNAVTPAAAPAAPAIRTATAGNATATATWTAPANNGSPITGYSVKVVNSATNTQIGALRPAGATATSLLVTGLVNGTAVKLQVQATNATGTGAFSALSNAVTPAAAPAAPAIGSAAAAGATSAKVTWTAPATGGSPITGYSVRVLSAGNAQVGALRSSAAGTTSLLVTGLTTGQAYHFTVTATNAVGTSVASLNSTVVTLVVPGAPIIGVAVAGATGGAITATANWTAPAANAGPAVTAYQIIAERLSATGAVLATTTSSIQPATSRTLSMTLPVAGNYRFSVRAVNVVGSSAKSAKSGTVAGR